MYCIQVCIGLCIFCMIEVRCRHNPPTTNKHEGTIHDALDLLASSLLSLRVGVSMHIYSLGHSKLHYLSVTQFSQLAVWKNGVFVI